MERPCAACEMENAVCENIMQWPLARQGALIRESEGKFCAKIKVKVQDEALRVKQRF